VGGAAPGSHYDRLWGEHEQRLNLWHDIDYNAPATGITVNNLSDNPSLTPEPDFFEAGRSIYDEYLPAVLERWHAERGWQNGD
jgi:hypothetical protein